MTKLEEAEKWLKDVSISFYDENAQAIADELDRLRDALRSCERNHELAMISAKHTESHLKAAQAELAALKGEAESTVYAVGTTADVAVACALAVQWWHQAEECQPVEGQDVYVVRLSARKVEP